MAKIAVINAEPTAGGAEAVTMATMEALQNLHEVHFFSFPQPDIEDLNSQFSTRVQPEGVHSYPRTHSLLTDVAARLNAVSGDRLGAQLALKYSVHYHLMKRELQEFDLRINTSGELPLTPPAIQYLHRPVFFRHRATGHYEATGAGRSYQKLVTKFCGISETKIRKTTLITNSEWSADAIEKVYGTRPGVVYPPVDINEFSPNDWEERENGFVLVGRVASDKRTHRAIEIVDKVRNQGHDIHLHIIGPRATLEPQYMDRIQNLSQERSYVSVEGKLPREDMIEMIENHKWGIHAKPNEHFGIAVAELVAGGTVPFIPSSGGQTEIVGDHPGMQYSGKGEAADKICHALTDQSRCQELRNSLPSAEKFSKGHFKSEIRDLAAKLLSNEKQ